MTNGINKLHVVYVTGESYIDHSYTIIKELRNHIKLDVYFIFKTLNNEIQNFLSFLNAVPVVRRRFRNPLSFFNELAFIFKLRKLKADLIWFNTLNIYQIFFVKLFLKKYLITLHDAELHPHTKDEHGKFSTKLLIRFHKNNICTASYSQAEVFRKQTGLLPSVLALPIIDYYNDVSSRTEKNDLEKNNVLKFFFFGTIEKYKGIEQLIEAAVLLGKYENRFEVNIYGRFGYFDNTLFQRIKEMDTVNLYNEYVDYKKVSEIYNGNDVLVLPYKQVTQCGPLLIAYSFNVPALCSDQPGFREYIEDGRSGFIFGNSPTELAEKMEMIINNSQTLNGIRDYIKTSIKEKFSMKSQIQKYLNVLNSI